MRGLEAQREAAQMNAQQNEAKLAFEAKKHEDEIAIKREQIQADLTIAGMREDNTNMRHSLDKEAEAANRVDTDKNGIDDYLDIRRTDIDENFKNEQVRLQQEKLNETQRNNLAKEELARQALKNKGTSSK